MPRQDVNNYLPFCEFLVHKQALNQQQRNPRKKCGMPNGQ
jgi:hypothetical protein